MAKIGLENCLRPTHCELAVPVNANKDEWYTEYKTQAYIEHPDPSRISQTSSTTLNGEMSMYI
jgi:hypothetical protein